MIFPSTSIVMEPRMTSKQRSALALVNRPDLHGIARSATRIALYQSRVAAGSPGATAEEIATQVTLDDILLHHPNETFLLRVTGDSMNGIGMDEGDLLTVDRRLLPRNGDTVVACIDGQTTVKTLKQERGTITLVPQNAKYQPIEITPENDFSILGVVTNIIRSLY